MGWRETVKEFEIFFLSYRLHVKNRHCPLILRVLRLFVCILFLIMHAQTVQRSALKKRTYQCGTSDSVALSLVCLLDTFTLLTAFRNFTCWQAIPASHFIQELGVSVDGSTAGTHPVPSLHDKVSEIVDFFQRVPGTALEGTPPFLPCLRTALVLQIFACSRLCFRGSSSNLGKRSCCLFVRSLPVSSCKLHAASRALAIMKLYGSSSECAAN